MPAICDFDLIQNGYVDENGNPFQPETFDSDSVWSYELGAKSRLLDGKLYLDGSVYRIEWKDIQANVSLPNCAYNFVDNLGTATSEGFDIAFSYLVTERLTLSGAYGYNDPSFDEDATSPGGAVIFAGGSAVPNAGAPETFSLTGEYVMPIGAYQGYARLDYTWSAEWRRVGDQVPTDPFYDPRLKPTESYGLVNLRLGVQFGTLGRVPLRAEPHQRGAAAGALGQFLLRPPGLVRRRPAPAHDRPDCHLAPVIRA